MQILHLQERYDKMVAHNKKTGGCFYYEPLWYELSDTFGAMENIAPDSVYSSTRGLLVEPNSMQDDDDTIDLDTDETGSGDKKSKNKNANKCKYFEQLFTVDILNFVINTLHIYF